MKHITIFVVIIIPLLFSLSSCITPQPNHITNICSIFKQYPKWYWATEKVAEKWRVPIAVQMAIVYQESRFQGGVRPPREKLLWIIPWVRPTSAYGYSQALDGTWSRYKRDTGNSGASRSNFADAVDFIGWYSARAHYRLGLSRADAFRLYLAYHEGLGGYQQGTYRRNPNLIRYAKRVALRADIYQTQLNRCRSSLSEKHWWHFW